MELIALIMEAHINLYRLQQGLPTVPRSEMACGVAETRLEQSTEAFQHTKLAGIELKQGTWYENLGRNGSLRGILTLWKRSGGHNKNLLADVKEMCVKANLTNFVFIGYGT